MLGEARLHHVCLRVSDLERAARFYGDLLGLERLWAFTLEAEHARALFDLPASCRFVTFAGVQGRLEIFSTGEAGPVPVPGQHFCWLVPERDSAAERLRQAGVPIRESVREGRRIVFASDPDGNWFELKPLEAGTRGESAT